MQPKDWIPLAVGLLTFSGVMLNLWVTLRNRTSSHRDLIYKRQLEEYEKFLAVIVQFNQSFIRDIRDEPDKKEQLKRIIQCRETAWKAIKSVALYAAYDLEVAIGGFDDALSEALDAAKEGSEDIADNAVQLSNAYFDVVKEVRRAIGLPELSGEIAKVIGIRKV